MWIFWGSAIGSIALGITWAKAKGRNPVNKELLKKSLNQRLERGEISREEYDRRIRELSL